MKPVILVTFAGRQKRMEILTRYIRKAMDDGLIDEWHVWDFTRSASDRDWVTDSFGPARFMGPDVPYQDKGSLSPRSAFRTAARISNDLHLAIVPEDGSGDIHEIVVGGWKNTQSVVRKISRAQLSDFSRNDVTTVWSRPTPGVLSPAIANQIVINADDAGVPSLHINGVLVGSWPFLDLSGGARIMVRGGWGADLELTDVTAPVRRYVGNPDEKIPYWQAYDYYSRRFADFSETLFLKCDDDIVYMDLDKLNAFIDFRRNNPHYFIVSANVVNNGVCAYWQQVASELPEWLGQFERPPGGFGGSLWQSAERAVRLHDYFLDKPDKHMPLPGKVIEWRERQSINFIAWLGQDLKHMALPKCDDEYALTVDLPTFLNRPTAIFSDFTVSHLSFGPQDQGMDLDRLIDGYETLMQTRLSA